jgi:hypothetical protein
MHTADTIANLVLMAVIAWALYMVLKHQNDDWDDWSF